MPSSSSYGFDLCFVGHGAPSPVRFCPVYLRSCLVKVESGRRQARNRNRDSIAIPISTPAAGRVRHGSFIGAVRAAWSAILKALPRSPRIWTHPVCKVKHPGFGEGKGCCHLSGLWLGIRVPTASMENSRTSPGTSPRRPLRSNGFERCRSRAGTPSAASAVPN